MPKYYIYDNDNQVGHLILKRQELQQFESVASLSGLADNTLITYLGIMLGTAGFISIMGTPSALSGVIGVATASGIVGIKSWRGYILPEKNDTLKIEAEFKDLYTGTIYRDIIENPDIDKLTLIRLCKAIKRNEFKWVGRIKANLFDNIKRTQHTIIREEFIKVGYLTANNHLEYRGKMFVGQVAGL